MQMNKPTCSSSSSASDYCNQRDSDNFGDQSDATISLRFNERLQLDQNNSCNSHDDEEAEEFLDCEDGEEANHEGDDDFTFIHVGQNDSPNSAGKASENGQIQPVFPLFDQNLLSGEIGNRSSIQPPADKVFVESSLRAPSSSTEKIDEVEGLAVGPYCTWSKQSAKENPELRKKSNSTGFSKLWRLRGKVGRSNSDGRDAFVFLRSSDRSKSSSKSVAKRTVVGGSSVKSNATGGGKAKAVKKGTKAQKENLSAHEVYLKKREQTEEERRRSYLPYRPEIMGFFTNVNGGLSRNVHPY